MVDLEKSSDWQALNVNIISIALDPAADQLAAQQALGIQSPMAVDADRSVTELYDVARWAIGNGEPGHTFVLVDGEGKIRWIRDYGAPDLVDRTMYVETGEMVQQVRDSLQ
ncbi:MAG: redoxin domain-containing protein [Anaerolineae bacterium]|nr:redoxin domain-containing protein [Anaerolineae bacterium]